MEHIRTNKFSKVLASYLAIQLMITTVQPSQLWALTSGPSQPEFNSFTPIGTSDMVNLSNGNFNYNIPIMDVGGYPLNLAYDSGVTMDQEASWVGLGWNMSVGQISRNVRGIPDDFKGDKIIYENNMKDNVTIGANFGVFAAAFGGNEGDGEGQGGLSVTGGFGVKYNNYNGLGFSLTNGLSYQVSENLSVGMNMTASASEGTTVEPSVSLNSKRNGVTQQDDVLTGSLGVSMNSRQGITGMTISAQRKVSGEKHKKITGESKGWASYSSGGYISFADASFTPSKRVGMVSSNYTFSMNLEGELWGFEPGTKFKGYRTSQGIRDSEKYKEENAYGFENTASATKNDVLDFNREKDRTFNQYTTTLPITNNTYDLYSIQGQGVSGMFRPYKSQVGHVFDNYTKDISHGGQLGLEIGAGGGTHWGIDGEVLPSNGVSQRWSEGNFALPKFMESETNPTPNYENVFFKNIGGFHVDEELNLLEDKLGGYHPIKPTISGSKFARVTLPAFQQKNYTASDTYTPGNYEDILVNEPIKRTKRLKRNQSIQKLTRKEASQYGFNTQFSPYSLAGKHDHHTSEIRIFKDDGSKYIYGLTAYNVVKKEVTFDISGRQGDCKNGLVTYNPGSDNTPGNNRSGDQYFNRISTPAYAHSYLLTSVLSSDYEDLTGDGPSDDDLGAYTKFTYENKNDELYKWRVPYDENKANYNQGIRSSYKDDKGNYIYGEKELVYIKEIETKTHIAKFELSERKDALGVNGENGGGNQSTSSKMWKLDKIFLYAKPEYEALGDAAEPIKVAHFTYDYSLCKNVKNNFGGVTNELSNDNGKLTLKKVYFTYGKSNMGAYTPYEFEYSDFNPNYDQKGYNIWGNYKPTSQNSGCGVDSDLTNAEFPYVDQGAREDENMYASAWALKFINLPSGGKMEMQYESDDYRYVQNKEAMEMFKVVGAGSESLSVSNNELFNDLLYKPGPKISHFYIRLNEDITNNPELVTDEEKIAYFKDRYIRDLVDEAVYFRFLMNMTKPGGRTSGRADDDFDFVTGYLQLKNRKFGLHFQDGVQYASIPVKLVNGGKGVFGGNVNPVVKAGWHYGRHYLNRKVYSISNEEDVNDLEGVVMEILGSVQSIFAIFSSPNGQLQQRRIARRFIRDKSWIRLKQPDERKLGGGHRVSAVKMYDQWDLMTERNGDDNYSQFYGQEYNYDSADGKSSGVATYEPLGSKENPLVQPVYDRTNPGFLLGPDETNYVEKPIGESFFPSPSVTYSRVTVKNLQRKRTEIDNGNTVDLVVRKHATGKVVTEFYTSYDYPTITDYTALSTAYDKSDVLSGLLNLRVREHLTLAQGYSVHTNDMDGKMKSQRVYAEGQTQFISGVDYNYDVLPGQGNTDTYNPNQGRLNNVITTIAEDGTISKKLVGVDYDVINDFRDSETISETYGVKFNTAGIPITIVFIIVPVPLPRYSRHENRIKTAVTTKVIHSSGILREKVAYDVGASVSTKNLAWDAATGNVILTETTNEYKDKYYNFTYPAYWYYKGMDQAARNLNLEWKIESYGESQYRLDGFSAKDYLIEGDELWVETDTDGYKAWVVNVSGSNFTIVNEEGLKYTSEDFDSGLLKVIRSGHRNMQTASMASVTAMVNPIEGVDQIDDTMFHQDNWSDYRIVNASAVEYSDIWEAQCECDLPVMEYDAQGNLVFNYDDEYNSYNPYRYNIKGDWRAKRSFAYLTGRNFTGNDPTPRKSGFFNNFRPLYKFQGNNWLFDQSLIAEQGNQNNTNLWTFASAVTQYSPYGMELENRDALNRYSSAQYGYNYKLPIAVASNTQYKELGYDGFEDYEFSTCNTKAHFSFHKNIESQTISISTQEYHSGKSSLKVGPGSSAIMSQQIVDCEDIENEEESPAASTPNNSKTQNKQ
jgi:hypothetical protein